MNSPLKSIYPLSGMGVEPPLDATTAIRAYGEPGTRGGRVKTGRGGAAWKPFAEPILEVSPHVHALHSFEAAAVAAIHRSCCMSVY